MESKISIRRMILGVNICIYETLKSFVETFTEFPIIKHLFLVTVMYVKYEFFYLILTKLKFTV
jgi:hypothetical protein